MEIFILGAILIAAISTVDMRDKKAKPVDKSADIR
jgi:hypothetical protein